MASRRHAEQMILDGLVKVNGLIVREMGVQVDEALDVVSVDGKPVKPSSKTIYFMLNKPQEVVTTCEDPQGRRTVLDLLPQDIRIYPVGRLDYMTEGLLLLTNDGDLANQLTHPKYKIAKKYWVVVKGYLSDPMILALRQGIELEDGLTLPAEIELLKRDSVQSDFFMTIYEGRNRQVRRMCAAVSLPVIKLRRVQVGPLKLGNLQPGQYRQLREEEIAALRTLLQGEGPG